jgi:NAD(P) transhydrogenase subunit alpha
MTPPGDLVVNVMIFVLAGFLGMSLITHVSRLLHTPLMSLTNAISSVSVVAALIVLARPGSGAIIAMAAIAVACSATNAIGGFMMTERILRMFKRRDG